MATRGGMSPPVTSGCTVNLSCLQRLAKSDVVQRCGCTAQNSKRTSRPVEELIAALQASLRQ
eukprot:14559263-Heterocapsa_arctica.AAC.1